MLDTRPAAQFGAGHVPGSINIGLGGQFASWAGRLLGLDTPLVLVAEDDERVAESRMRLARVGIENVVGYLEGGVLAWSRAAESGRPVAEVPQVSVLEIYAQVNDSAKRGQLQLLDVRRAMEWQAGHVEQATHVPLDDLRGLVTGKGRDKISSLDPGKPVAIHCKSGYRSSIAASLLLRAGYRDVWNVVGGFDAWQAQKLPVVKEEASLAGKA